MQLYNEFLQDHSSTLEQLECFPLYSDHILEAIWIQLTNYIQFDYTHSSSNNHDNKTGTLNCAMETDTNN